MRLVTKLFLWGGVALFGAVALAAAAGSQVLPPGTDGPASNCAGQVPIVVGSDAAAQSDLYSAATLAGVLETSCIVLAGPRDGEFPADQVARLDAAAAAGWVMGGEAAVPAAKVAGRNLKRLNGVDRWHTARLAGAIAADPDGDVAALTAATAPAAGELGGGSVIVDGVEVRLPPGLDAPCEGQVPIVVAVDAAAQSDLYSAATLAGVLDTTCFVLAGARGEPMLAEQRARLIAAETSSGAGGWIVGGDAAVPQEKIAGFNLERQGGEDRWATARFIGVTAVAQAVRNAAEPAESTTTTATTEQVVRRSSGGGGTTRRVSTGPSRVPTVTPSASTTTTSTTSTTEPMSTTTTTSTTLPDDTTSTTTTTSTTLPDDTTSTTTTSTTTTSTTTTTEPPQMASLFTPSIEVSVPQLDGVSDDNIWVGEEFEVVLARASGADEGCSLDTSVTVTYTVQADGAVTTDDADLPETLVGTLADGMTTCDYAVTFPAALADNDDEFDWTMTAPATTEVTVSEASQTATGPYTVGEVTFDANAAIRVPFGHATKQFEVDFMSAQAGCVDRDDLLYTVQSDNTVVAEVTNAQLVAYPAGATMTSDECTFTVAFPTHEADGAELTLVTANPAPDVTVRATDQDISATYIVTPPMASTFAPTITVSVPQLDGVSGENLWAAREFEVMVGRASGAHADCSLDTSVTVTYTVQADGQVTTVDADLPEELVGTLVDQTTKCSYVVTFPAAPVDTDDGDFDWVMTAPAAATLSEASQSAAGAYLVGEVTFAPDATISVPSGSDGAAFDVEFAGDRAACSGNPTAVTHTYTVPTGGTSAAPAAENSPSLVAYPAGATAATDVCSYTVTFPQNENGALMALVLQTGADATATGTDQSIAAEYEPPPMASSFTPLITVTVPELDGVSGDNIWADETFEVTVARASGAHADCSLDTSATVTYTVQADGTVTTDDADLPETLLGTLIDQTTKCNYEVTFPAAPMDAIGGDFGWTMSPATTTTAMLSDADMASMSAAGAYTVGVVTFLSDATITVPAGTAQGTSFAARFSSSQEGCTAQTLTYVVAADGTTVELDTTGDPSLVAYPADADGSEDVCAYGVVFSASEVGAATLSLANGSSPTVSGTSQTISAAYTAAPMGTMFGSHVRVRVPFVDGDDPGTDNDLAGTEIEVWYRPVANSQPQCRSRPETFTVAPGGSVFAGGIANPPAVRTQLIDVPAGGSTTPCEYEADFADSVAHATLGEFPIQRGDNAEVSASSDEAAVVYAAGSVLFPDINIHVAGYRAADVDDPATMVDETMVNLFRGSTFAVSVSATGGPTASCTGGGDPVAAEHSVGDDGTVAFSADGPMWIDVPDGETDGCVYTVTFPDNATPAAGASYTLALPAGAGATASVDAGFAYAFREYRRPAATSFGATVTVAGVAAGSEWEFSVAPTAAAPDHCTPQHRWRATAAAGTTQVRTSTLLTLRPVDRDTDCIYTLTWPTSEVGGTIYSRVPAQTAATVELTQGGAVTATFERAFTPSVSVSVPMLDGTTPGTNIWATETFEVTFERVSGVTHADCSLGTSRDVTFTVQPNGSVTPDAADLPASLVHTTADGTACSYTVAFPDAPADNDADFDWTLVRGTQTVTLDANNTAASSVYALAGDVTFTPDVTITVPMSNANKTFNVEFASETTDCSGSDGTPVTHSYTVSDAAASTATADNPTASLIAYPASATDTDDLCEYTAAFPTNEEATATPTLRQQSGADTALTGTDQAVSATYVPALRSVSSGGVHSCGVKTDGSVVCWGSNDEGQLTLPSGSFTQVSAGGAHSCGVLAGGSVECWGSNARRQSTPSTLGDGEAFTQVSAGTNHSCGVQTDGTVACWGHDDFEQVSAVPSGSFTQVSAGWGHSCALKADGSVECWGFDSVGQSSPPTLEEGERFTHVSAGTQHSCGLKNDGSIACWGADSSGQLSPPQLAQGASFTQVSVGYWHSCAVTTDGAVACWGSGSHGRTSPPTLEAGESFTQVSAGEEHSCALKNDGSVACWGADSSGRLTPPAPYAP